MCREADGIRNKCKAYLYNPLTTPWKEIRDKIMLIGKEHFGKNAYTEDEMRNDFTDQNCVVVLSKDTLSGEIIGYSYAAPLFKYKNDIEKNVIRDDGGANTAYI
jgi:hypothetical protein